MNESSSEPVAAPPAIPPAMPSPGPTTSLPMSAPVAASATPSLPPGVRPASPWARLGAYLLEGVLIFVTLGIGWAIWATMTAPTGQTPAKKLLNQRVVSSDTLRPVGFGRMFWVRGLLAGFVAGIAIALTLGILLLMPFWDRRKQNIWDKISGTYVVLDSEDAWGTRPDLRA